MNRFTIISHNKANTIGVVTDTSNLKSVGNFSVPVLKEWLAQVESMLGDDAVHVQFKMSEIPGCDAHAIFASVPGEDEKSIHVVACGKYTGGLKECATK